jgi:hypothetical protein
MELHTAAEHDIVGALDEHERAALVELLRKLLGGLERR